MPVTSTPADETAYSFRPYDQPQPSTAGRSRQASSIISDSSSSWAPSQSTARTTPPPSVRGSYSTRDPDKIVVRAVYLFDNEFSKTPTSQLLSGIGPVSDGLILRITTEGLFIDDDVRGVPQREWDVKAWTLKLAEVWCPHHCLNPATQAQAYHNPQQQQHTHAHAHHPHQQPQQHPASPAGARPPPGFLHKLTGQRTRDRDRDRTGRRTLTGDEADAFIAEMLRACRECCLIGLAADAFLLAADGGAAADAWRDKSLHVLRATVRDQNGKRYLFVVPEEEGWKLAIGLQRLRRGTQARSLGVAAFSTLEVRNTIETLGW